MSSILALYVSYLQSAVLVMVWAAVTFAVYGLIRSSILAAVVASAVVSLVLSLAVVLALLGLAQGIGFHSGRPRRLHRG
jgi:hypothetical protein